MIYRVCFMIMVLGFSGIIYVVGGPIACAVTVMTGAALAWGCRDSRG